MNFFVDKKKSSPLSSIVLRLTSDVFVGFYFSFQKSDLVNVSIAFRIL